MSGAMPGDDGKSVQAGQFLWVLMTLTHEHWPACFRFKAEQGLLKEENAMENRMILSGEVESCTVRETCTELQLLVGMSADTPLRYLGPQTLDVLIPDEVMMPTHIERGTALRVQGLLMSDRRMWSLHEFMLHAAPEVVGQVKWGSVDPHNVSLPYPYSQVVAKSVTKLRVSEGLNVALLEGTIVSKPRMRPGGRVHLRVVNYPDEPIALLLDGKHKAVYGTLSVKHVIDVDLRVRVYDGMLYSYEERESLAYFLTRRSVNVVWPSGFNPHQAAIPMRNLAVGVRSLSVSGDVSPVDQREAAREPELPIVPAEALAMYAEPTEDGAEFELEEESLLPG
jgi:hypothetical protein